jgi:hypothetical protein
MVCGKVIRNNGCFERLVIFSILKRADHRFGREPMAEIAAGSLLAFFRSRTGAFTSIATVGFRLREALGGQSLARLMRGACGAVDSGVEDLASNPEYLASFGRDARRHR